MTKLSRVLCLFVLGSVCVALGIYGLFFRPSSSPQTENPPKVLAPAEHYYLQLTEAGLEIRFSHADGALYEVVSINTANLPSEEISRLREGISISGHDALSSLLEDYSG